MFDIIEYMCGIKNSIDNTTSLEQNEINLKLDYFKIIIQRIFGIGDDNDFMSYLKENILKPTIKKHFYEEILNIIFTKGFIDGEGTVFEYYKKYSEEAKIY